MISHKDSIDCTVRKRDKLFEFYFKKSFSKKDINALVENYNEKDALNNILILHIIKNIYDNELIYERQIVDLLVKILRVESSEMVAGSASELLSKQANLARDEDG